MSFPSPEVLWQSSVSAQSKDGTEWKLEVSHRKLWKNTSIHQNSAANEPISIEKRYKKIECLNNSNNPISHRSLLCASFCIWIYYIDYHLFPFEIQNCVCNFLKVVRQKSPIEKKNHWFVPSFSFFRLGFSLTKVTKMARMHKPTILQLTKINDLIERRFWWNRNRDLLYCFLFRFYFVCSDE